jgi:hypothetical protein
MPASLPGLMPDPNKLCSLYYRAKRGTFLWGVSLQKIGNSLAAGGLRSSRR